MIDHRPALRAAAMLVALAFNLPAAHAAENISDNQKHVLQMQSGKIAFNAFWSETVLKDATGTAQATISSTSYVRTDVKDSSQRPVMFAFNGGPGASSFPLHTGLLGPRILGKPGADGKRIFSDNPYSVLDIADVVLIDPVGTGFNRELREGGTRSFWSADGDAKAVESVIREWLRANGRTASPVYIAGESYGGFRIGVMASQLTDLNIAGLVLVSPAFDLSVVSGIGAEIGGRLNDQAYVFDFPSMAVAAWHHTKDASDKRTVQQIFGEARAFAVSEYNTALYAGYELPLAERDRVATRMATYLKIPVSVITANNLRVPMQEFREQVLPGKVIGRTDSRIAGPKPPAALVTGRSKSADDPALGLGKSSVIKSAPLTEYLKQAAGYRGDQEYVTLSLIVTMGWDWRGRSTRIDDNVGTQATVGLHNFLKAKPQVKVLMLSGYYDLATTFLAQRYQLTHVGIPAERMKIVALPGGHTVYDTERPETAQALRAFLTPN